MNPNVVDAGPAGAAPAILDQCFDRRRLALEYRFDTAVPKVAHPTVDPCRAGSLFGRASEVDALDLPLDDDSSTGARCVR